jgi:adenylate cyclase
MTQEGFKRKLAAILNADVVGYSRLMRDDEEATVRDIASRRVLITEIIQQHHGRVIDSPGDNILAEFASVVDAVNGAIKIQDEIKKSNADTPKDRRMEFRIGINLGDVIEEEERIYGDGVNIAARVEGLATGGGIAISGIVYDSIKDKLSLGYHYLGEQDVKNIPEPVRVYRLLTEPGDAGKMIGAEKSKPRRSRYIAFGAFALIILVAGVLVVWNNYFRVQIESASVEKMAFPLPEKPSIAVMPFENLSGDPEQQYFSDGITEQIITSISKVPYIFVIARQSSFAFRDKQLTVQQIAKELGVRYILEGSLQLSGERLRINVQLIDATSGHHIWAENYDRKLDDIFAVQDEICKNIMVALQVKLTMGEMARIHADTATNIRAYEKYLKGLEHYFRRTKEDSLIAQQLLQEAITLDPEYITPYIRLGSVYLDEIWFGMTKTPSESIAKAEAMVQKAIDIKGDTARSYILLSHIYLLKKDLDKAIAHGEKAVEQTPSDATPHFILGMALRSNGQYEAAISSIKKALRLNPVKPLRQLNNLAWAYLGSQQQEKAISTWNETIERNPDYLFAYMGLTAAYWIAGFEDRARQAAKHVLRISPKFSVGYWEKRSAWKDKAFEEQVYGAFRKAGLPE